MSISQLAYDFGLRLRAARELRGLSQADLADEAGLPAASISHFERGKRMPSLENFRALADALDADAGWLLCLRTDPPPSGATNRLAEQVDTMTARDQRLVRQFVKMLRAEAPQPHPSA